jgi:2-dehydropantoate 2-reductase
MRILVVGAGAVSGYFGGRLAQAGRDVTFLVRPRRAEQIRKDALRIVSPYGDAVVHPVLVMAAEIAAPYDLILLGVKAYSLEGAMNDIAPGVGPDTMILPLLNGMNHLERLSVRFGERAVLGGVCMVSTDLTQDGTIVQLLRIHSIYYGERAGGISQRMRSVERAFAGAGFDSRASDTIVQDMWEKWIQLASLGALTCLMRGNIGEIASTLDGSNLALQIIDECNAIARASGYPARDDILARVRENLTARDSKLTSSMFRDLSRGGVTEADQILGNLLERGRAAVVPAPLVEAAFTSLTIYHARLQAAGAR